MSTKPLRRFAWALPLIALALVLATAVPRLAAGPATVKVVTPAPFPPGFDYPQSSTTVQSWVSGRNGSRMRQHGWNLFAGLNQATADGTPVWRTWYTSTDAFPFQYNTVSSGTSSRPTTLIGHNRANAAGGDGNPTLTVPGAPYYPVPKRVRDDYPGCVIDTGDGGAKLKDGPTFQSNGDVMIAGVIYNLPAFNWIRQQQLYDAKVLDFQLPLGDNSPPKAIAPFPSGSIVLKPMLWPVQGQGYTALPVWDDLLPSTDNSANDRGKTYSGFEVQSRWNRAVAVWGGLSAPPDPVAVPVTYLYNVLKADKQSQYGPITYTDAAVVPVTDFYYFRYSAAQLQNMNRCDRALLDASAIWAYNRPYQAGDFLVLIAMHIMTKEQPNWTFQSAWWHDKAHLCGDTPNCQLRYGSQRPANVPGPSTWQNYMIVTTYGEAQVPGNINTWPTYLRDEDQKWPVAYNPYIELAATHPIATNCMNCHHRAAWPSISLPSRRAPNRHSSYLAGGADVPDTLDVFTQQDKIFNGLLTLDSMWAVSDRANYPK
jgi:hypothetical protein